MARAPGEILRHIRGDQSRAQFAMRLATRGWTAEIVRNHEDGRTPLSPERFDELVSCDIVRVEDPEYQELVAWLDEQEAQEALGTIVQPEDSVSDTVGNTECQSDSSGQEAGTTDRAGQGEADIAGQEETVTDARDASGKAAALGSRSEQPGAVPPTRVDADTKQGGQRGMRKALMTRPPWLTVRSLVALGIGLGILMIAGAFYWLGSTARTSSVESKEPTSRIAMAAEPTFTAQPTYTVEPTYTSYPTLTREPMSTATPYPTNTPYPTYTSVPTSTTLPTSGAAAGAGSVGATPTAAPPGLLFEDTFDLAIKPEWEILSGDWRFKNNLLTTISRDGEWSCMLVGDTDWDDYAIEVKTVLPRYEPLRLYLRAQSLNNAMYVSTKHIWGGRWDAGLFIVQDGESTVLVRGPGVPEESTLRFEVRGDFYTFYVDGIRRLSINDPTYGTGLAGFCLYCESDLDCNYIKSFRVESSSG